MLDFNELINNFLKREVRQKLIGKYYPSDSGSCLRKTWYSYKIPREVDVEMIKFFEAGNMVHSFITNVIKSEKNPEIELLSTETPIFLTYGEFIVSGRMDDVALIRVEGKIYILEIKSIASLAYCEKARDAHITQLQLYMHSSGIRDGLIVYIERNNLQTKSFKIEYDEQLVKDSLARFSKLHSFLKADMLPEPESRANKQDFWQCDKCQYKEECYTSNPKTVELP